MLTNKDIEYLRTEKGESEQNINQIKQVLKGIHLLLVKRYDTFYETTQNITEKEARELLGDEHFLSCLDRCAFHHSATGTVDGDTYISFHSSFWK